MLVFVFSLRSRVRLYLYLWKKIAYIYYNIFLVNIYFIFEPLLIHDTSKPDTPPRYSSSNQWLSRLAVCSQRLDEAKLSITNFNRKIDWYRLFLSINCILIETNRVNPVLARLSFSSGSSFVFQRHSRARIRVKGAFSHWRARVQHIENPRAPRQSECRIIFTDDRSYLSDVWSNL